MAPTAIPIKCSSCFNLIKKQSDTVLALQQTWHKNCFRYIISFELMHVNCDSFIIDHSHRVVEISQFKVLHDPTGTPNSPAFYAALSGVILD